MKTLILLLTAALAGGASQATLAVEAVRESRAATGFTRVEIEGQADVVLRQGAVEAVTIEASAEALRSIKTVVRDRTLIVEISDQRRWWDWALGGGTTRTPRMTIDFVRLDRIEAAGVVRFDIPSIKSDDLFLDFAGACTARIGDLQASRLRVDGSGAVKLNIAGKVPVQSVELSGASSYQAGGLVSDSASLEVSGAGKAVVNATKSLKVEISGAGAVSYVGNPTVQQEISGVGKVRRVDAP